MLEPSVKQRLLDRNREMSAQGTLLTQDQLTEYYATFRARFGPEQLAALDGEALLETMHAHGNRDSLVYWLEFKNDDEFPALFGSIAGGSALKFGIFRRKETNQWQTGDRQNFPRPISVQDAIAIARKHRDQLLRGVELLRTCPPRGTDEDYANLQAAMDRHAPDVSDLAWGHKYFSLLFPDRLDDYHSPQYQRFHLVKMLQRPPDGEGRYLCAGRFVAAAHELGIPINNLTTVLNAVNGSRHRYWRIGTSDGAPRNRWPLMRDGNCVAIGWAALGDLSFIDATKDSREKLRDLYAGQYPNTAQAIGRSVGEIMNFVTTIADGDLVLPSDGAAVLGVGRVTGDYWYDRESDFPHRRPVEWLSLDEWRQSDPEGLRSTVRQVRRYDNQLEVERRRQRGSSVADPQPHAPLSLRTGDVRHSPRLVGIPGRLQAVLERKGQVILYGPPGTGKTFWAEKAALDLAAYASLGKPFGNLTDEEKGTVNGSNQTSGLVRTCCFHPSYGYEDFIEGYRPRTLNGQVTFQLRDGVFKQLCNDAQRRPQDRFFLIIDEVNRGDIPRIFGELLTVLEKDKRDKPILLPVSGDTFRVPLNVFLIGTMNTADRSISLLDAALRRRFGFVELMPDSSTLRDHSVSGVPLGPWLDALNRRVCEHVGRDARNLQVGHSYLLQDGRPLKDFAAFRRALRDDIIPLLEEYCYADFNTLQSILGSGLVDVDNRCIRDGFFDDGQEDALVQALLQPCPEILASSDALASEVASEPDENEDEQTDP